MVNIAIETIALGFFTSSLLLAIIELSKTMNRFNEYRRNARFLQFFDAVQDGKIPMDGHPFDLQDVYKMTMDRLEKLSGEIDLSKLNTTIPLMIWILSGGILGYYLNEVLLLVSTFAMALIFGFIELKIGWGSLDKTGKLLMTHGRVNPYES